LIIQVILLTAIIMMVGLMVTAKKRESVLNERREKEEAILD
jgi:peptidoglycan biosynthesis protein MviN/MurJ (putative lipid II flippase)